MNGEILIFGGYMCMGYEACCQRLFVLHFLVLLCLLFCVCVIGIWHFVLEGCGFGFSTVLGGFVGVFFLLIACGFSRTFCVRKPQENMC